MGSKEDRGDPIPYSFNNPLLVSDLAASLFNRSALSDTREEDKQEGRQKGKKRRDDE